MLSLTSADVFLFRWSNLTEAGIFFIFTQTSTHCLVVPQTLALEYYILLLVTVAVAVIDLKIVAVTIVRWS